MYLVIKSKTNLGSRDYQSVLKAFKSLDNVVDFIKRYIEESTFKWHTTTFAYQNKKKTRYVNYSKDNNSRQELYIKYMKLYD